jgi:hypothetical protein
MEEPRMLPAPRKDGTFWRPHSTTSDTLTLVPNFLTTWKLNAEWWPSFYEYFKLKASTVHRAFTEDDVRNTPEGVVKEKVAQVFKNLKATYQSQQSIVIKGEDDNDEPEEATKQKVKKLTAKKIYDKKKARHNGRKKKVSAKLSVSEQ